MRWFWKSEFSYPKLIHYLTAITLIPAATFPAIAAAVGAHPFMPAKAGIKPRFRFAKAGRISGFARNSVRPCAGEGLRFQAESSLVWG